MNNTIINDDCFEGFSKILPNSIDLVVVDLPYGQIRCEWDITIDLTKMWNKLKIICKKNCQYIFFCSTKFGNDLINSNPKWFRYDLVWEKSNGVGFLNCNKMPLRKHEMIYIFNQPKDNNSVNMEMKSYSQKVKKFINKSTKIIEKETGICVSNFFTTSQFKLCSQETYNTLIDIYKIDQMDDFIKFDNLTFDKPIDKTYNPIKTEGKAYKSKIRTRVKKTDIYNGNRIPSAINNEGDRFPTSILKHDYDKLKLHSTQKPISLCEWLIKTYSNENDLVLDFTMGSGSTIVACINTKRRYIGIEKNKEIFEIAEKRINDILNTFL